MWLWQKEKCLVCLRVLYVVTAAAAKSPQSCPTLCDPIDGSPPGSAVPGILQARTLEWVAISFSNAWKWNVKVKSLSCFWLLVTLWSAAYQAPLSMGFSRQEYWSGVPLPFPLYMVGVRKKRPSYGKSGSPCIIIYAWLSRRRQLCCVCVSKKASLCLVGTRNWPSCRMLTIAASVTDVLLFRDSFCGI